MYHDPLELGFSGYTEEEGRAILLGAAGPDGKAETVRVHFYGQPGLDYIESQGYFSDPKMIRIPSKTGSWHNWKNLQQVSPTEWTIEYIPTVDDVVGIKKQTTDSDATCDFRLYNEMTPRMAPINLPSGVVIDLNRSSATAKGDIMYSPRGMIADVPGALGPIYFFLRDVRDVLEGLDPANVTNGVLHRDMLIIAISPLTGACQAFPVDQNDANADNIADDLFHFAKQGSVSGG